MFLCVQACVGAGVCACECEPLGGWLKVCVCVCGLDACLCICACWWVGELVVCVFVDGSIYLRSASKHAFG